MYSWPTNSLVASELFRKFYSIGYRIFPWFAKIIMQSYATFWLGFLLHMNLAAPSKMITTENSKYRHVVISSDIDSNLLIFVETLRVLHFSFNPTHTHSISGHFNRNHNVATWSWFICVFQSLFFPHCVVFPCQNTTCVFHFGLRCLSRKKNHHMFSFVFCCQHHLIQACQRPFDLYCGSLHSVYSHWQQSIIRICLSDEKKMSQKFITKPEKTYETNFGSSQIIIIECTRRIRKHCDLTTHAQRTQTHNEFSSVSK